MGSPLTDRKPDLGPQPERLTAMERLFIRICCTEAGLTYKEVASRMGIALSTLHTHREKVFAKLKVPSRTAMVLLAVRSGLG